MRETGTSAARRISVMAWYEAPLRRSSAIPGLSLRNFCHFRGTVGAYGPHGLGKSVVRLVGRRRFVHWYR